MMKFILLVLLLLIAHSHAQSEVLQCNALADIYIVATASDTMVELLEYIRGLRNGLTTWFSRTQPHAVTGPQISVCAYGETATEQIVYGSQLNPSRIQMVGGISHLDLGVECARRSSEIHRRPGVRQFLVLIVGEDPLGFFSDDFREATRTQIALARAEGFHRVTLTTVSNNVDAGAIADFADPGFHVNILPDFSEFATRIRRSGGVEGRTDPLLWRQFCPEDVAVPTVRPTTPNPIASGDNLCDDCIIFQGIGYNFFEGDCRRFVQCLFDETDDPNNSRYQIKWTALGAFWKKSQVEQHHASDVDCEWDPCKTTTISWTDERNCNGRWICGGQDQPLVYQMHLAPYWRNHLMHIQCDDAVIFAIVPDLPRTVMWSCCNTNERYDDSLKACVPNIPGANFCQEKCPIEIPTFETICDKELRPGTEPDIFYDKRQPNAAPLRCLSGMVFSEDACSCVGLPRPFGCAPILEIDFADGEIKDRSKNRFWISNVNVLTKQDPNNGLWYGEFAKGLSSMLYIPGLANLDLMRNWAMVVDYDAVNNENNGAALIGSTNCLKERGAYSLGLIPNSNQLEAYVRTRDGQVVDDARVTMPASRDGIIHAVYQYRSQSGLSLNVNSGTANVNSNINGTMWRDHSLCGFHIGYGQEMDYYTGRIYKVAVYRDPDCIPINL